MFPSVWPWPKVFPSNKSENRDICADICLEEKIRQIVVLINYLINWKKAKQKWIKMFESKWRFLIFFLFYSYFTELTALLVFGLTIHVISSVCPKQDLFQSCVCQDDPLLSKNKSIISCIGTQIIDLGKLFENLSQNLSQSEKQFYSFHLQNTAITELKDNTFKDITFEAIVITCSHLTKINKNSFNGTGNFTSSFYSYNSPLSSDIFEIVKKFTALRQLGLYYNNFTEIPSNAFKPLSGNQEHLEQISISGMKIKKLSPYSFSGLTNLSSVNLYDTSIDFIPDNTFANEKSLNQTLNIGLYNNPYLNGSSFAINSLANIRKDISLSLSGYQLFQWPSNITYLNEKVFLPFLMAKEKTGILLNSLNCSDCRNYWLVKNKNLSPRINNLRCSNSQNLLSASNFKKCSS